ncbi:MAG TPA: hypothetical protein VIX89_11260, partial [Bryobacteraceae bacterium]
MTELLEQLKQATTWQEMQSSLGQYLGMDGPAPLAVVRRTQQDEQFRHYLITCRNQPQMLRFLLADPRNDNFKLAVETEHSTPELVAKLGKTLFAWGKAGLTRVSEEVFERRFSACRECDRLMDPPDKTVYRLVTMSGDQRICGACGCMASRKARLPHESCPVP